VHLFGFIIRIYRDARSHECQILGEFQTAFHVVKFYSVRDRSKGLENLFRERVQSQGVQCRLNLGHTSP